MDAKAILPATEQLDDIVCVCPRCGAETKRTVKRGRSSGTQPIAGVKSQGTLPRRRSRICDRSLIALNFFGRRINGGVGANFFPALDYLPTS